MTIIIGASTFDSATPQIVSLTIASALVFYATGPIPPFYASVTGYGFDAPADGFGYAPGYGAVDPSTYTDGDSNTRTIIALSMQIGGGIYAGNNGVVFALSGASIPDTDATFVSIENLTTTELLTRSSAAYSTGAGYSAWSWSIVAPFMDDTGVNLVQIHLP